ncbi:MAG: AAA family ATPase [Pseudomonadota bacterium]
MPLHLESIRLHPERYPVKDRFPFNVGVFARETELVLDSPVTIFVGENGTGKSTLLEALARRCGIHIWRSRENARVDANPYEERFYETVSVAWTKGPTPGAFFGSSAFSDFRRVLERWAVADPGQLDYFGGRSLLSQSHGQSIMSFFRARYTVPGLYLMDEPETALSPKTQLELLDLLKRLGGAGNAQFIMATHSPILLACPDARIYSFDHTPIRRVAYKETDHYRIYRQFLNGHRP